MHLKDINQNKNRKYPRVWNTRENTTGTTKIAAAFVCVNGSVIVQSDTEPQALSVYLSEMPVMDWRDIKVCKSVSNSTTGTNEWVINVKCCGLVPVEMDYYDGVQEVSEMLKNSTPTLDMLLPPETVAFDGDVTCKSIFIADYLDVDTQFHRRPNAT